MAAAAISTGIPIIVYLDCLVVRSRDSGCIQNKSVYLVLGVNTNGEKELLGLWIAQTEGAKFRLSVMNEVKIRSVEDIFNAGDENVFSAAIIQVG